MEPSISVPANKKYNGFLNIFCFYQDELAAGRKMFWGMGNKKTHKKQVITHFLTPSLQAQIELQLNLKRIL